MQIILSNQKNILTASNTINPAGDSTIITAVSNQRICVTSMIVQLEAVNSLTVLIKAGSTVLKRILLIAQGDALVINYQPGFELKLPANTPLVLNLSSNIVVGYSIEYYLE